MSTGWPRLGLYEVFGGWEVVGGGSAWEAAVSRSLRQRGLGLIDRWRVAVTFPAGQLERAPQTWRPSTWGQFLRPPVA